MHSIAIKSLFENPCACGWQKAHLKVSLAGYGAARAPQVWKWIFTAVCFLLAAYPGPPQDTGATVLIS